MESQSPNDSLPSETLVDEQLEKALQLHTTGKLAEAEEVYRQVLRLAPDDADANHLLGAVLAQQGRADDGLVFIDRAIAVDPTCADFHNNRGLILAGVGRTEEALAAHRKAIELNPQFAEAWNNLGNALVKSDCLDEAAVAFRQTIQLRPNYANAHSNLGVVLQRQGKFAPAIASYRTCLKYQPNHAEAQSNLGVALRETGHLDQAIAAYRAAISIDDHCVDAHANLGAALHDVGQPDEAIASHKRAIELNPQSLPPHYNLALTLLQGGDYARGLAEYEFRAYAVWSRQKFSTPPWDGRQLAGRSILLHGEGGFGDAIQFARFVPLVKARGGNVILHVQPELVRLFSTLPGVGAVIPKTLAPPMFEFQSPLLSLPRVFNTDLQTIPNQPYLSAHPSIEKHWSARLRDVKPLRVGLAWAGSPRHHNDRNRSIALNLFAPLAALPNIHLVSLQQDQPSPTAPPGLRMLDWATELRDFADTAGLIANLDLVIAVDTAAAHLAAAMGKKVYLLLPKFADWRWLRDRTDSPWYPTTTIFRQTTAGDWPPVIASLVQNMISRGA